MGINAITFDVRGASRQTLAELSDIIKWRAKVDYQSYTKDALIATVITALKSLRALTRANRGKLDVSREKKPKLSITYQPTQYHVDWYTTGSSRSPKYCLRTADGRRALGARVWWRVPPGPLRAQAKVYRVRISEDRQEAWPHQRGKDMIYLVAADEQSAIRVLQDHYGRIVRRYSKMGKGALTEAMKQASDRPARSDVSRKAKEVIDNNVHVKRDISLNLSPFGISHCFVEVNDELAYATDALQGGASAVDYALKKAANSVTGYVNRQIQNQQREGIFANRGRIRATPFPEAMTRP